MTMTCCACAARDLVADLRVAGEMGHRGLAPTTDAFGVALSDLVHCTACGHRQLERMPSDAALGEAYGEAASDDYIGEEAGQRETARRALARIERWMPGAGAPGPGAPPARGTPSAPDPGAPPARGTPAAPGPPRLLDLGCWVGFLLAEARERGWEGVGVEPSAFASTYARERLGLDVRREGLLDADLPAGAFDAAILGDVIEHLPRPGAALDRVATLLRTGGPRLAWLSLPDAGSRVARAMGARWWSVIPTHVQYFTRGSLATLLHRHGWEVLEVATAPKAFTVRYYLERTGGYSPTAARALVRAARLAGVADRMWAPDFHDRMQVIARARG
jgi:SAM-dependent methyltransferase